MRLPMDTPSPLTFAALGDGARLSLVSHLADIGAPQPTTKLARHIGMSRQGVRKHLDVLARAGFVRQVRRGRERLWSLDARPLRAIQDWAAGYRSHWEAAFDRLEALLDEEEAE